MAKRNFALVFIFSFLFVSPVIFRPAAFAQGNEYQRLSFEYNRPYIYLTTFSLPGQSPDKAQLVTAFQIGYRMLSFRKVNEPGSDKFYATPTLHIELFKSPEKDLTFEEQVSIVNLEAVARKTWSDTVFAANYKATQNASNFATGFMVIPLAPGRYTFILEFGGSGTDKQTSGTRNIKLNSYRNRHSGEIIFAGSVAGQDQGRRLNLMNRGSNVIYTENFYAFIHLPSYSLEKNYILRVHRIKPSEDDTVRVETVFEEEITDEQVITEIIPELSEKNDELYLELHQNEEGYAFALVQIPNSSYKEATYKIEVFETAGEQLIAQKVYRSVWFDKPVSLYSTDLAIEMLRFIADEQTIEKVESGSAEEEREKLNEFWEERDPTPNTEFNELKAEYYRRIDYAYEHFGSPGTAGFTTDRGRIYILYGPPKNIERVYLTEGATREIWTYANRRFVFKATSGFGDFILIEN